MATPKTVNKFNYRTDDEIDAFYTINQNPDEDMAMWKSRVRERIIAEYFKETKGYEGNSFKTQLSKHWTAVRECKQDAKVGKLQTWNFQKRMWWKNFFKKKYENATETQSVAPEKIVTRVSEVFIDYKEKYESEKREKEKLQMKLQQSIDKYESYKREMEKKLNESEKSKEVCEVKEDIKKINHHSKCAINVEEHQPLVYTMENGKKLILKNEFETKDTNRFIHSVFQYFENNDDSKDVKQYVENYIIEMCKECKNQITAKKFLSQFTERLACLT
jgi:hypothetical protein